MRLIEQVRSQWMGALALFLVIAGGTAYAADTIGSADVIDNSLGSVDLKNNAAVQTADVRNGTLNDEDVAKTTLVDFVVNIGNVPAHQCHNTAIDPFGTDGAHLVLTPGDDSAIGLTYSVAYDTTPGNFIDAYLITCNHGATDIDDGNTHFNLLVIDAR
jgi:hypothetical protein